MDVTLTRPRCLEEGAILFVSLALMEMMLSLHSLRAVKLNQFSALKMS